MSVMTGIPCACGQLINGPAFTDSANPGQFLCRPCAADANREHPGSVTLAFVLVDLDTAAREVAAALRQKMGAAR